VREPVIAFIGLGGNLGDALATVRQAIAWMAELPGTQLLQASRIYRSAPVDAGGPDYFNAVARIGTRLSAPQLLAELQRLELRAGRERPYRNAPRTLDLDLLLYGDARIASAVLTVPHPRMRERAFVLLPLAELAPEGVDPRELAAVSGQRIAPLPPASSRS
jgi:2-amino-4-hydroxy-6-hydroxymethyldihydropteridine diphosphokinase